VFEGDTKMSILDVLIAVLLCICMFATPTEAFGAGSAFALVLGESSLLY
jgi:hypothetical protein